MPELVRRDRTRRLAPDSRSWIRNFTDGWPMLEGATSLTKKRVEYNHKVLSAEQFATLCGQECFFQIFGLMAKPQSFSSVPPPLHACPLIRSFYREILSMTLPKISSS